MYNLAIKIVDGSQHCSKKDSAMEGADVVIKKTIPNRILRPKLYLFSVTGIVDLIPSWQWDILYQFLPAECALRACSAVTEIALRSRVCLCVCSSAVITCAK